MQLESVINSCMIPTCGIVTHIVHSHSPTRLHTGRQTNTYTCILTHTAHTYVLSYSKGPLFLHSPGSNLSDTSTKHMHKIQILHTYMLYIFETQLRSLHWSYKGFFSAVYFSSLSKFVPGLPLHKRFSYINPESLEDYGDPVCKHKLCFTAIDVGLPLPLPLPLSNPSPCLHGNDVGLPLPLPPPLINPRPCLHGN